MNDYSQDLHFDAILPCQKVVSHKQIFMTFAKQAEKHLGISAEKLFDLLIEKESSASSGIGNGVAIPHLQVRGPQKPFTIIATLERPLDFNAIDNEPVDIVCLVMSPQSDGPYHLRRLSRISRLLKNKALRKKLVEARDTQTIHALLIDPEGWLMAA